MPEHAEPPVRHPAVPSREPVQRWRLVLHRDALDADQVQKEQLAAWEAALRGSGLPLAGLDAENGRPRFAVAAPLAPGVPGEAELADLWLVERRARWIVRAALVESLPAGSTLVDLYDVWLGEPALPGQVVASVYRARLSGSATDAAAIEAAVAAIVASPELRRERQRGERTVAYDLRPFIETLAVEPGPDGAIDLVMVLRHDPEKGIGRAGRGPGRARRAFRGVARGRVGGPHATAPRGAPSRDAPVGDAPAAAAARSGRRCVRRGRGETPQEVVPALGVAVDLAVRKP